MQSNDSHEMPPIRIPIEDVLDLHTFKPEELHDLLTDYLAECRNSGLYRIRIIHGKGAGILKNRVHSILKKMPDVVGFSEAPPEAGGWGATIVHLKH